jgi:signal transduction histidine kinase
MSDVRGARQRATSIDGLGSWAGVRPVLWVRVGTAVGAISYLAHFVACLVSGDAPIGDPVSEGIVAVVCSVAFLLASRRPALGAAMACAAVAAQVYIATVLIPSPWVVSPPVLPVVVLATGLFFGARAALGAAAGGVIVYPLVQLAAGRIGPAAGGIPPLELSRLVTTEFSVAASGILTWLALETLARVHAEAEERRSRESQLRDAQRLQVVGELAGVAVHDLRNILGVVYNTSSLLSSSTDPAARQLAEELLQSARSGQGITARLLSLARKEEPQRAVIDVARAVGQIEPLVARLIGPRCTLELAADGIAPAVADPAELEQVVLNLVSNARDAMAEGGIVAVRVRGVPRGEAQALGSVLEHPRQVVIEVRDHGPGIAPELQGRIFEPFVTTKPRGKGTGLGLATVRSIANGSGGEVSVESAPGAGATFRVFLPEAVPA